MDTHNKHFFPLTIFIFLQTILHSLDAASAQTPLPTELHLGFKATPNPSTTSSFQPILTDATGNYSLGFLRVNQNQLTLSVLHVPSLVPLWSARTTRNPTWGNPTHLSFNGSLVLSDTHSGVFWSTRTNGDRVWLSNNSNLQIEGENGRNVLWQSFDFPTDTLVETQNFTNAMTLVSSNGIYSMQLGPDFFGLYARFAGMGSDPGRIYLKHRAMQAKADIIDNEPIHLVLQPDGYLGMFQNGSVPVDVASFNTFQQNLSGIRRVRIELDGNLKGYYWTGSNWVLDYEEISNTCELPSSCGPYSLCNPGKECSCLDNRTVHGPTGCNNQITGHDFCGSYESRFNVLRKKGVDLPFKELMGYTKMGSIGECESACEGNCTCWGVVYSNSSGFCYMLDYPIQTLLSIGDETKMGYFKVRVYVQEKKVGVWLGLGLGLLVGVVLIFGGVLGLMWYKMRSRRVERYIEEGNVGVGPYKDLGAASFRSIELCDK